MMLKCLCGGPPGHPSTPAGAAGLCADCYKALTPEERGRWIAKKARAR